MDVGAARQYLVLPQQDHSLDNCVGTPAGIGDDFPKSRDRFRQIALHQRCPREPEVTRARIKHLVYQSFLRVEDRLVGECPRHNGCRHPVWLALLSSSVGSNKATSSLDDAARYRGRPTCGAIAGAVEYVSAITLVRPTACVLGPNSAELTDTVRAFGSCANSPLLKLFD